jgi:hypothetical protein
MEIKMKLEIGTKITWASAAGQLDGKISNIRLDLNGAKQVVPWITISEVVGTDGNKHSDVYMCATDEYLKQMKVQRAEIPATPSKRHGGPWDRGSADSWYSRPLAPHYYVGDTGSSELVERHNMTDEEISAYYAGYEWNEKFGGKKEW